MVVCAELSASLEPLITHLESQRDADSIELVVACPSIGELGAIRGRDSFAAVKTVEHRDHDGGFVDLAAARAAAVRAASASLVVLGETHCFPAPGWAEALVAAHESGEPAVVGPVVLNANPKTVISWANLIMDYGPWLYPTETGPGEQLPGHNSCYRRDELLAYDGRLAEMLAYETALHDDLRRRGRELVLSGDARVRHLNVSVAGDWMRERFQVGRAFSSARSSRWPLWRRALYVVGAPLIPLVRFWRLAPNARRAKGRPLRGPALPGVAGGAGCTCHRGGDRLLPWGRTRLARRRPDRALPGAQRPEERAARSELTMRTSIVIPTVDREPQLSACLRAIHLLEPPEGGFEVVVVDDGSRRPLDPVVAAAGDGMAAAAAQAEQPGPGGGAQRGRGAGARELLAFVDDDVLVSPGLASRDGGCPPRRAECGPRGPGASPPRARAGQQKSAS